MLIITKKLKYAKSIVESKFFFDVPKIYSIENIIPKNTPANTIPKYPKSAQKSNKNVPVFHQGKNISFHCIFISSNKCMPNSFKNGSEIDSKYLP